MDRNDAEKYFFDSEFSKSIYFACNSYTYPPIYTIFWRINRGRSCLQNVLNLKRIGSLDPKLWVPENGPKWRWKIFFWLRISHPRKFRVGYFSIRGFRVDAEEVSPMMLLPEVPGKSTIGHSSWRLKERNEPLKIDKKKNFWTSKLKKPEISGSQNFKKPETPAKPEEVPPMLLVESLKIMKYLHFVAFSGSLA